MKKSFTQSLLFILLVCLSFTTFSCKKDIKEEEKPEAVTPVQKPILFYFGGTWNIDCGAFGKSALEGINNQFGDDAVIISCQLNGGPGIADSMSNSASNHFANFFNVSSTPIIFIGGKDSLTYAFVKNELEYHSKIRASSILSKDPIVYGKPKATITDNNITVSLNTEFLEDINNEVRVSVLLKESYMNFVQVNDSRTNTKNIHHHVLRANLTNTPTGISLKINPKKGDKLSNEFKGTLPSNFKKELSHVVVIYWVKTENGFRCLNAEQLKLDLL